jgi:hypothetical protein
MKNTFSRRSFVQSGALLAAAGVTSKAVPSFGQAPAAAGGKPSPVHLGLASYTFRNFTRDQMIGYMKQLNVKALNCKDVKDHLRASSFMLPERSTFPRTKTTTSGASLSIARGPASQ